MIQVLVTFELGWTTMPHWNLTNCPTTSRLFGNLMMTLCKSIGEDVNSLNYVTEYHTTYEFTEDGTQYAPVPDSPKQKSVANPNPT
jgi:hypothetical protein